MINYLLKDCFVVNEGKIIVADVFLANGLIIEIGSSISPNSNFIEINAAGKFLFPGVIDDQVHFREPGLTHKATIYSESKSAVAGGVTSFMEMPNTIPPALSLEELEKKYAIGASSSMANYSFFMGTSNTNVEEVLRINDIKRNICGVKMFMGSSTGNMLVDNLLTIDTLFRESELLIATHCEDEKIIKHNLEELKKQGVTFTPQHHPIIRNAEACFESSLTAIQIAKKYNTRLHILHISTAKELQLFSNMLPIEEKRITAEVCVHHLHYTADDYDELGYKIKCNPAIKSADNKQALWEALLDNRLDVIATDHAPHLLEEKQPPYEKAHSGLPLVQHSLQLMLYYYKQGKISLEFIAEKMSHAVAKCFQIENRGFIREGYYADLVLVDLNQPQTVSQDNIYYKCGWSPLEGTTLPATVTHTWVNGNLVYNNGTFNESEKGMRLSFNR